jgi:hypothetical protein
MDPISLLVIAAISAAVAAAVISWRTVQNWIAGKRVRVGVYGGTARIINERMQNGNYRVVAGVFDSLGTLKAQQVWKGGSLDHELTSRFQQNEGVIVVHY